MTNHFAVVKWGIMLLLFFSLPITTFAQITVDNFIGVNTRGQDPINRLEAAGIVREFHPWVFNEGFPNNGGSPVYPNNLYRWNPNYIDFIQYDDYYNDINSLGISTSPVTIRSTPQVTNIFLDQNDPNAETALNSVPVEGGADQLSPSSYIAHAAYLYQYAARYGNTVFTPNRENSLITPRLAAGETSLTGLGVIEYLENWNEPDQFGIFSPEVYAAMLSADYDGHGQTLGLVVDPDNPGQMISTVGIKNADPNLKVVLAGLEDANLDYIRDIVDWSVMNRPAGAPLPFDVINIHQYLGNDPIFTQSTSGVSPEEGGLRAILEPFVAYRDSLMPSVELWLSEFGYDTNNNSFISVPTIGNFTQYQVQGQWIIRSYLETIAAGFDRAMVFDLRDACTGPFCTVFTSTGLLETQANGFKPKDSWYYVSTMKNVMEDMVFDADLTTCSDFSCPRVYRFTDPNMPGKRIYAVWSPTSDGTAYNFNLDLEGATAGTLVELATPSITGISSALTGTNPSIPVSESPVFVIVGDNFNSGVGCTSNLSISDQTCGSLKVNWDAPNGVSTFQLWYMEGNQTVGDFSLANATLVSDEIDANSLSQTVADLPINMPITFFLIPEGVAVDASNPNAPPICSVQTMTLDASNTCKIPLDPSMIFDPFVNLQNASNLVDEQATLDPFCQPDVTPSTFWGFDFPADQSVTQERLSLDLGAFYDIDILAFFDGAGIGELTIQRADSPNGPWTDITTYLTISTDEWRYFTDFFPANQPVRFLRFIASENDGVQIGELVLCGNPSASNPNIIPGTVSAALIADNSCNSVSIDITAPFDRDIAHYSVEYGGNSQTFPYTGDTQTLVVSDLPAGSNFNFSIITVDNGGLTSPPFSISSNTFPAADCQMYCNPDCSTQLCLFPSWITDLTPIKPDDYDPTRLIDEQETAPVCGNNTNPTVEWGFEFDPFDGLPPVIARLDLQKAYNLDSIFLFDGNGAGAFSVDYLDENGEWQPLINHFTNPFQEWVLFEHPEVHARYLRLTKADNDANINEVVIHATPYIEVDPPSGEISDFTPDVVNCNDANISWTIPTNSNINQLKLVVTTTNSLVETLLPPNTSFYTIDNLLPGTVYEVFLFAENSGTAPTDLEVITFQTPSNGDCNNNPVPAGVSNFQIIHTDCEEVTLSWNLPANQDIAYYKLTAQPDNIALNFGPCSAPIAFDVNNLQPNTNYTFNLSVFDFDNNESTVQTISGTTLAANQCSSNNNNGNCNPDCPTFICIEDAWINEISSSVNLDASRLFDEPHLGNPVCGELGIPNSRWGEEYTPGLGIPPIICIIDLQQPYNLDAVYIYDIEGEGTFRVEYQDASGNWVTILEHFTQHYNRWIPATDLNITAQNLRFTKIENQAKIGEVAIFGMPVSN